MLLFDQSDTRILDNGVGVAFLELADFLQSNAIAAVILFGYRIVDNDNDVGSIVIWTQSTAPPKTLAKRCLLWCFRLWTMTTAANDGDESA